MGKIKNTIYGIYGSAPDGVHKHTDKYVKHVIKAGGKVEEKIRDYKKGKEEFDARLKKRMQGGVLNYFQGKPKKQTKAKRRKR